MQSMAVDHRSKFVGCVEDVPVYEQNNTEFPSEVEFGLTEGLVCNEGGPRMLGPYWSNVVLEKRCGLGNHE